MNSIKDLVEQHVVVKATDGEVDDNTLAAGSQSLIADNYVNQMREGIISGIGSYIRLSKEEEEKLSRDIEEHIRSAVTYGINVNLKSVQLVDTSINNDVSSSVQPSD